MEPVNSVNLAVNYLNSRVETKAVLVYRTRVATIPPVPQIHHLVLGSKVANVIDDSVLMLTFLGHESTADMHVALGMQLNTKMSLVG